MRIYYILIISVLFFFTGLFFFEKILRFWIIYAHAVSISDLYFLIKARLLLSLFFAIIPISPIPGSLNCQIKNVNKRRYVFLLVTLILGTIVAAMLFLYSLVLNIELIRQLPQVTVSIPADKFIDLLLWMFFPALVIFSSGAIYFIISCFLRKR